MAFASKFIRGKSLYYIATYCCALSFCMYGYDAGVLGGVQTTEPFLRAIGHPTGAYTIPMIASAYTLASTVMSVCVMFIGMPLGRRKCIALGDMTVIVGASIQASSWSIPQIIVGRILCGFGIGFISCTVPTYMAEMTVEAKARGPEVAYTCIWLIWGVALAYWVDFGFTRLTTQVSWRFPIAFQAFFATVSLIGMLVLPDTPRWYYAQGREASGDDVLMRLHDLPLEHEKVQEMKSEILASIKFEEEEKNKFRLLDLIWDRSEIRAGRRIRIAFMILSIQQMMGINLAVYYSTVIFSSVGLSAFVSQLLAAVLNTVFAIGTIFCLPTIERWGRRPILIWSSVACSVCMLIFVVLIGLPHQNLATQWTAIAFIIVWIGIFGWGWIGVPWLYGPEIAPLKFRHIGGAAGAFGEWLFSFITVFAGGVALNTVGWKIWIWMLLFNFLAIPFCYFMCPEVAGKTLEEIDLVFATDEAKHSILASRMVPDDQQKEPTAEMKEYV